MKDHNLLRQFTHLRSYFKFILPFYFLSLSTALLSGCSDAESVLDYDGSTVVAGTGKVTVFDAGLNMAKATYTVPSGWKLVHDIATDPNTGRYTRYKLDKYGPDGEVARNLPPVHYGLASGRSFDNAWQQAATLALQDVDIKSHSNPAQHGPLIDKVNNSPYYKKIIRQAGIKQLLEVDFKGFRNNKPYEGKVLIAVLPTGQQSGVLQMGIAMSPPGLLMQTIDMDMKISQSVQSNPQYELAYKQINQRVMQGMQARHEQKMRANQQQFDSHQKMMQGRYNSAYQQNEQWMNDNLRSSGNQGGSNGYTGHDATIDGIHDRETFYDPSTGQNVSRDGYYDYNYTDGQGNFYSTDNPNNPPAGYQETDPLRPNY